MSEKRNHSISKFIDSQRAKDTLKEKIEKLRPPSTGPFGINNSAFNKSTPHDLSERHDDYLYGDSSNG